MNFPPFTHTGLSSWNFSCQANQSNTSLNSTSFKFSAHRQNETIFPERFITWMARSWLLIESEFSSEISVMPLKSTFLSVFFSSQAPLPNTTLRKSYGTHKLFQPKIPISFTSLSKVNQFLVGADKPLNFWLNICFCCGEAIKSPLGPQT